jgi:FkbM family methyltransferase
MVAALTRLYPFYSGCGTMANCSLVRLLAGDVSGPDWVRLRQGPHLLVELGDYLSNSVYFSRDWDRKISWVCERLLRPGDVALDIGANLGLVTCQMAALVGPQGQVHAFEPNPAMTRLLERSIFRNQLSQIKLYPIALGETEQDGELTIPVDTQCLATLSRVAEGRKIRVPVKTLDTWFASSKVSRIRLMKIDVEGFEEQVFRGSGDLFKSARPDALLFELNTYDGPFEEHPSIQFLRAQGYDFLMLPKKLVRMRAKRFSTKAVTGSPSNDLVAAPSGTTYKEIAQLLRTE